MPLAVENAFCDPLGLAATMETPGKKRKRNAETNPFLNFTEHTFSIPSSTPIHNRQIDGSSFENPSFRVSTNNNNNNKENFNIFHDSGMEVKSIADLAAKRSTTGDSTTTNPFEVVRKPPKKKKKQQHSAVANLQESCFENAGLNLAAADKQPVNPFEVPRDGDESKRKEAEEQSRCFVNNALNIRGPEAGGERYNPFEIVRPKDPAPEPPVRGLPVPELAGIENPALEVPTYAIAVPFTPSLKHRINFQELPVGALTPCQMLANMVVCSPDVSTPATAAAVVPGPPSGDTPRKNTTMTLAKRRSLSVISEESDIGEKLDCYQLELENSINEAKARKQQWQGTGETTPFTFSGNGHRRRSVRRSLMDMRHISNLSQKLRELDDDEGSSGCTKLDVETKSQEIVNAQAEEEQEKQEEENDKEDDEDKENQQPPSPSVEEKELEGADGVPCEEKEEKTESTADAAEEQRHRNQITFTITKETTVREEIRIDVSNPDVQFEEVEDFEDEEQDVELLHNPAPFQRAYRKKEPLAVRPAEEEFKCPTAVAPGTDGVAPGKSHKVRDVIRRSFRRLIHPHEQQEKEKEKGKGAEEKHSGEADGNHGHHGGHGLISTIRHSLRRRQPKATTAEGGEASKAKPESEDAVAAENSPLEMSIIAEQPRAVFRQPSLDEYRPIAAAPSGGASLRGSLRRSTKDIRKQMMKTVFRKQSGDLDAERVSGEHAHAAHMI